VEAIIVHGGAWNIPKELHRQHIRGCKKAVEIGYGYLDDAIIAVVETVAYMEDDDIFDAGVGSFLNEDGEIEMDAIVYGQEKFGSVLSIKHFKNPVKLAREIYSEDDFSILTGQGAEKYAKEKGFKLVNNNFFKVNREIERYKKLIKTDYKTIDAFKFSTVGAVAVDKNQNIAVALSTGGTPLKKKGRIGDTAIPGAGAYATDTAGVAATGHGEAILSFMLAKRVCDEIKNQTPMEEAAKKCIREMGNNQGYGGVISLSRQGEYGYAYNTRHMAIAFKSKEKTFIKI
jgi:beta-aspartyl-peptidase (threonine type)